MGKPYSNGKHCSVHVIDHSSSRSLQSDDHSSSDCSDSGSSSCSYSPYKQHKNPPSRARHYEVNGIFYIDDVDAATRDQVRVDLVDRNSIKFMPKINTQV